MRKLVREWFEKWEAGDFHHLPIASDFQHTSPFGTIEGKDTYLDLVESNRDKFLGYRFEIHDEIHGQDKACIRYKAIQGDFTLDVSEWHYARDGLIEKVVAYYHIGEIREERELSSSVKT